MLRAKRRYPKHRKRSNTQLLKQYGNLAKYIVGRYAKAFRLTPEQSQDLHHELLCAMFRADVSYRNPRGISIILKTQIHTLIGAAIKNEREIKMGLLTEGDADNPGDEKGRTGFDVVDERHAGEDQLNERFEAALLPKRLKCLSSSERAVIGMSFGVDAYGEFRDEFIARKLRKNISWVVRKRQQAIGKLRMAMNVSVQDSFCSTGGI